MELEGKRRQVNELKNQLREKERGVRAQGQGMVLDMMCIMMA